MAKNKDIFKIKSPKMFNTKRMNKAPRLKERILKGDVFKASSKLSTSTELTEKHRKKIQELYDEYKVDNVAFVVEDTWGMTSYVLCNRPYEVFDDWDSLVFFAYVVNEGIGIEECGDVGFIENKFGELERTL